MKIRSQLLVACFVLAVLPLTGIVFYSYESSRRAVENAYHREATRLAAQMDRRLGAVQTNLDQSLAALSVLLPNSLNQTASATEQEPDSVRTQATEAVQLALGDMAPLVERLQIVPMPPARPRPRETAVLAEAAPHPAPVPPVAAPEPGTAVAARVHKGLTETDEEPGQGVPAPPPTPEPVVVEVPRVVPSFSLPPDFSERMKEITRVAEELNAPGLMPEDRQAKVERLKTLQSALNAAVRASRNRSRELVTVGRMREEANRELLDMARQLERDRHKEKNRAVAPLAVPDAAAPAAAVAPSAAPKIAAHPAPTAGDAHPSTLSIVQMHQLDRQQVKALKEQQKRAGLLFGGKQFNVPLRREGEVVGHINAELSTTEIVKRVLGTATDDSSEIPFAVDREGTVYTRNDVERATLNDLGIIERFRKKQPLEKIRNWVVAMSWHRGSGLRIGVARPVGESFEELRRTAARNFGWGVGVIAFALLGMVPIANHFTRDVKVVTEGAERVAQGDLQTRVPVRSKTNEFGQLAMAFNRMAEDLSLNQQRLVEQERTRQEQEIQQRLLGLEYERKSVELEDARRFQLSMLPKHVPQHARYDVAVLTQTAAEVGGDYYDFHVSPAGVLSVTIGDATGHGAKAGTMVTVIKTLFAAYDGSARPAAFLGDAAETIKRMELGRMAMALSLARFEEGRVTVATAGMPPMLVHRAADGRVDEVSLGATPLGTLRVEYGETTIDLQAGDTVLLMSDGLPELLNAAGQQLGYVQTTEEFAAAASAETANSVLARLADVARGWHGDQPPNDDITFVAVRVR